MISWLIGFFGNPFTLLWLPLASAPIIIHLWNRRKYREITWAAMEYLLAAIVKSSRRMRIEQLLLLAVRTLLILLVVFALAEPFLSSVAAQFIAGARTHRILVIDGSFSMGYRPADKHIFDVAKEQAIQIVENGNEGDAYSLIVMSDTPHVVVGTAAYDRGEFIGEIESLVLPHGGGNLASALTAVEDVARQVRDDQDQLRRHHVYILTDLGRTTWAPETRDEAIEKGLAERVARLAGNGVVEVIPLGGPDAYNVAVTNLRTTSSYVTITQPITLEATVRNFSDQRKTHQSIELWVDGRRADQQYVDILPGEETPPITFTHRFQSPGDHQVEIRLGGDPLEVDNSRYLVLPVKEHLNALCVSGRRGSTLPLEAALDGGDFRRGLRGTIRPHVVSESALLELDLGKYDCVFLCNVGQFTADEAQVLSAYLKKGGGLVTFLGDQVLPDRYNHELAGGREGGVRVLPARLGEPRYDGKYHFIHLDPTRHRHPLLDKWRGNPRTGLTKVPIAKYFRLELPDETDAQVVMELDTKDPLLVVETIERGRSILIATDASLASVIDPTNKAPWSYISSWLNSQPFFDDLWKAAVGGQLNQRNVQVGEAFGAAWETVGGEPIHVTTPAGPAEKAPPADAADGGRWSFSETDYSGFYSAQVGKETDAKAFAVNVDTRESDLERLHPDDLTEGFTTRSDWQDATAPARVDLPPPSFALHQMLLCLVLGLLFFETFLAWWFGNRSA